MSNSIEETERSPSSWPGTHPEPGVPSTPLGRFLTCEIPRLIWAIECQMEQQYVGQQLPSIQGPRLVAAAAA
ncbi:hypothetical protein CPLU01_08790 [Colletotrichum plurivorum]|uniref:Uncharacterized protein n=1 Tax=Colletotrichum plurivorum TaxID=2175906 RepID=A0A8H6KBC4_9PEZI|nr:hypothetical protein CPLU01_08790 [Colletotrichum plurivorum]